MDDRTRNSTGQRFARIDGSFDNFDGVQFARVLEASCDVTLILDEVGAIKDASFSSGEIFTDGGRSWVGRNFREIVTDESVPKVEEMLAEVARSDSSRPREINHLMLDGDDVPVSYRAARLNGQGDVVVFGQDISRIAALQRRLMSAQLAMEREVVRLRGAESRYRAIFQHSDVPCIMVDPTTLRIVDINPAALRILGRNSQRLENTKVINLFSGDDSELIHKLLLATIEDRELDDAKIRLPGGETLTISAQLFRQERRSYLLVSLNSDSGNVVGFANTSERKVLALVEQMPDAFAITNEARELLSVNDAFLELFNIASFKDVEGVSIDQFFERPNVDCNVLLANIREHGTVRRFASVMRSQYGQVENVEIAATRINVHDGPVLGFWIRPTSNVIMGSDVEQERVSRSNEQIANLVGHMPLKDIVRETTDMIEKLCIETALELTRNNRASAAQMLGVSRQSLYSKLGRSKDEDGENN